MRLSIFLKGAVCLLALALAIGAAASNQEQEQSQDQGQDQSQNQDPTGGIRGTVLDDSGTGIGGARITVSGGSAPAVDVATDTGGDYATPNLPDGKYNVIVSAKGFKDSQLDVEVSGDMVSLDVTLERVKDATSAPQI
jgi:hypothetical protein